MLPFLLIDFIDVTSKSNNILKIRLLLTPTYVKIWTTKKSKKMSF